MGVGYSDVRLDNSRPVDRHEVKKMVSVIAPRWPSRSFRCTPLDVNAVVDGGPENDVSVQIVAFWPARLPRLAPLEHRLMPRFQQGEQGGGLNADRVGVPRVIVVFWRGHRESPFGVRQNIPVIFADLRLLPPANHAIGSDLQNDVVTISTIFDGQY
jgi:hypothetical protein